MEEVKGYRINYDGTYYYLEIRDYNLNEEIEILEEEKKIPDKLDEIAYIDNDIALKIKVKINEIIDYLNGKGE